jgi:hypothetical protein
MLNSDENKENIFLAFPNLRNDVHFIITGEETPNYNCIAWAATYDDQWWWPLQADQPFILDGVTYSWPISEIKDTLIGTFIRLFTALRYEKCDDGKLEKGFRKICLYSIDGINVTHASRQITYGKEIGWWTSKLGESNRITHSEPEGLHGPAYGSAVVFMRSKWP